MGQILSHIFEATSNRIIKEMCFIARAFYNVSGKTPATTEWE